MANSSTLSGSLIEASESTDESVCRISGYLMDIHGNPLKSRKLVIRHIHDPMAISTTTLVLNEYQVVRSDSDGLLQFDVYRSSQIKVEIPGRILDMVRLCNVPDAASADLIDIVFPYVASVAFDSDDASVTLEAGETYSYTLTATLSDGEELDVSSAAQLSSSDEDVVTAPSTGSKITAVASGAVTISLDGIDTDALSLYQEPDGDVVVRLDEESITLPDDVSVTVS